MSLLTIAQAAAIPCGISPPVSVVGNPRGDVVRLFQAIKKECDELVEGYFWQQLRRERLFTAISGQTQTGILPADFGRMVPETFWDRTNQRNISAVASAVEWQNLQAVQYAGDRYRFVIRGGELSIIPSMVGGESLAFEYVSTDFARSFGGTPQGAWLADTDTTVLNESLVALGAAARFLLGIGQPAGSAIAEYEARLEKIAANDAPTSGTMLVGDIFGGGRAFSGAPSSSSGSVV